MTSPIELYVQCVELLESIHNQIESEKKKLNIVGTDIEATNKKIEELYVKMIKLVATADFKCAAFKNILIKLMGGYYFNNGEDVLIWAFKNEKGGRMITFNKTLIYQEPPRHDNNYSPAINITVRQCDQYKNAAIALLTFKSYDYIGPKDITEYYNIMEVIYSQIAGLYKFIQSIYIQYQITKLKETSTDVDYVDKRIQYTKETYDKNMLDLTNQIDTIKETYDKQIKELQQENQQFKQILIENKLIPEPMPEYNYTDIAKRIKPFKRELITITKWRKSVPFAVAISVKGL